MPDQPQGEDEEQHDYDPDAWESFEMSSYFDNLMLCDKSVEFLDCHGNVTQLYLLKLFSQ